jgi:hypothetical protein
LSDSEAIMIFESRQSLSPDRFYAGMLRGIARTPFLQIISHSEITRCIKLVSSRDNDPKGIIEISVLKRVDSLQACTLVVSVRDKQFAQDVKDAKIAFRIGVKGTLIQILVGSGYLFEDEGKWQGLQ